MFTRIWFYLREVVWTAVIAVALVVAAAVLELLGLGSAALIAVLAAIPFALLAMRD
jgi:hypothetical protein